MNLLNTIEYGIIFFIIFAILIVLAIYIMLFLKVPPYMYNIVVSSILVIYSIAVYYIQAQLNRTYHLGLQNIYPRYTLYRL